MLQTDAEQGYHYHVIRRAIEEIDRAETPLTLEALSGRMGMSAAHFQRLFSAWTGVSPKRFQQYLALGHAKALLSERFTVLEAAAGAGLSGGGRLHDLFLRWEAMSPGDYASGGAGLEIRHGWMDSPFGPALVLTTPRGICGIGFADDQPEHVVRDDLFARWPAATFIADAETVAQTARAAFGAPGELRLHIAGGPFQIKVWEALLRIPSGHVTTYGEIARAIGRPGASRAVGTAVGRNPVSWLIPCHRAIRATGGVGEYHWGQPVKRAMLAWEAARCDPGEAPPTNTPATG